MFDTLIATSAARWGVSENWIKAVIQVESAWDPNAVNPADPSYGLMQISKATAKGYGVTDVSLLLDPAFNIDLGTHLLSDLMESYGDDFRRVYSAYNSGDPDLWETSAQVAANVARAVAALAALVTPTTESAALVILIAFWFLMKRR